MTVGELRIILDKNSNDAYSDDVEIKIYPRVYPLLKDCRAAPMIAKGNRLNKNGNLVLVFIDI